MNDLIQRVVDAIEHQEGAPAGSTNPGNLRGAPWRVDPVIKHGYWDPPTREEGEAGLAHLVALHMAQGNTLRDFIAGHPGVYAGYAPGADGNKPAIYVANVQEWAQIPDADEPLWNYIL